MRGKLVAVAVSFGLVLAANAPAQSRDESWQRCASDTAAPDLKIGACTAIIQARGESDKNRNAAFYNRGTAFSAKGQYDRAIADFSQALKLDPDDGISYIGRGNAYLQSRDFDHAGPDFDAAIRLHAQPGIAYSGKGVIDLANDRYGRAVEDFGKTVSLQPDESEGFTMRCLARGIV
ncbi:MAG: tetratricopeptide repeat protein, partial [Stellaceae bacterium]